MTAFKKYATEAREKGQRDLARRIETEGKVCARLVRHALKSGYVVSVNDGEEWVVKQSAKFAEIMNALFSTDSDTLVFSKLRVGATIGDRVGSVMLIYGNDGNDVISDYGSQDLDAFSAWIKPVEDYADTL